jgi:hypothetical protein
MKGVFIFKAYKKPEFDSLYMNFRHENNINRAGQVIRYDQDGDMIKATIDEAVIDLLTEQQLAELTAIK